jgi:hypothetical protein
MRKTLLILISTTAVSVAVAWGSILPLNVRMFIGEYIALIVPFILYYKIQKKIDGIKGETDNKILESAKIIIDPMRDAGLSIKKIHRRLEQIDRDMNELHQLIGRIKAEKNKAKFQNVDRISYIKHPDESEK